MLHKCRISGKLDVNVKKSSQRDGFFRNISGKEIYHINMDVNPERAYGEFYCIDTGNASLKYIDACDIMISINQNF